MSLPNRPWLLATMVVAMGAFMRSATAGEIVCGETQVGVLGSGPQKIGFAAAAGEVVNVTVVADPPVAGFTPWWRIADVEGHPVPLSNGEHRCVGGCATGPLPRGGVFTIRIADVGKGRGTYVVSLEAVSSTANGASNGPPSPVCLRGTDGRPDGTRPVPRDVALAGTIAPAGETDTFTLSAAAGDRIHVTLERTDGEALFAPGWSAFGADGTLLARTVDETVPLATDGVVTILVADAALRATGTYALTVSEIAPSTTTTTSDDPSSTTSTTGVSPTTSTTTVAMTTTSTTTSSDGSTTSSSLVEGSTTTVTVPSTTTTLAPSLDLGFVVSGPPLGPRGHLGRTLLAVGGQLLIGAPHENVGIGASRVRDAGALLIVDVAGAVGSPTFGRVGRLARPGTPTPGDRFGTSVATAGTGVVVGAPGARAAYFFGSLQETAAVTFVPPLAGSGDGFGAAVAAPGDFVAVGAPDSDAGVVYVFERASGTPHAVLKVPGAPAGARLGAALASSGALLLVGAPGGAEIAGAAYLFDASTGALLQVLRSAAPFAGDELGAAVAFAGSDPVVGAPGASRVDRFDAGTGTVLRSYAPPSGDPAPRFGAAIAIADGTLVVGAPGATIDGVAGGVVFAFDVDTSMRATTRRKPMPSAGDDFGAGVAAGAGRVFVGAPGDDVGTADGGATYVFEGGDAIAVLRERLSSDEFGAAAHATGAALYVGAPAGNGGTGFVSRVTASGTENIVSPSGAPSRFGASVSTLGGTLVIGAPTFDGDADRAGVIHLYDGTVRQATIDNPLPTAGGQFGFSVGSVDGDLLASAPFADDDTGHVYRLDPTSGHLRVTYGKAVPVPGDFFGAAVAGDDGQVLVGAPRDASGGGPTGAVYLFDAATAAVVHAIPNPTASDELFGAAVALGPWIAVGAPHADGARERIGAVWMFDRATGALVRRLDNPRGGTDDDFGASVALMGEMLVVGAPLADDTAPDTGLVYLFDGGTGALLQTFRDPPQGAYDDFGFAVAANAGGVLVGSPGPSRVYFFDALRVAAGALRTAPRALAAPAAQCGNGLVEGDEACDDGNAIDGDDCTNACAKGPCCALDPVTCDDGDRCTTDIADPVSGCRYVPSGLPGCCSDDADCPNDGQCRPCVGCYIYHWDCCDTGSRCITSNAACESKTCVDAAYCQCEGKLACNAGTVPESLRVPFGSACDTLRLELSVEPDGTLTKTELVVARQRTRTARAALRTTAHMARALGRTGELSRACRLQVLEQVRVVRRAIPRGRKLRRCLLQTG